MRDATTASACRAASALLRCGVTIAPELALLTVSTVRVEDPGPLLALLPADSPLAWVSGDEGLVGWGEAARFDVTGPDRFADAQDWWRAVDAGSDVVDEVQLPGCGLVAFGSFSFDPLTGTSSLVVPEVVVGHRSGTWWVTTVDRPAPVLRATAAPRAPGAVRFSDGARSSTAWTSVVADVVERIRDGQVGKVVLARDLEAQLDEPLDVRWPLRRLAAGYPGCWTFSVDGLIGATPELLVRLEEGLATSRVLAGTIRRSGDAARDVTQAAALARSSKDLEEHGFAVRSVAESLSSHCRTVDVPAEPFVLHLQNVMHLASVVSGVVADGATSLGLVSSLHPSAAVCGTPTEDAMAVIREVEGLDRGRYAGPVGWMDASGDGEWGIALRCAELDPADPRRLRLFAGCGIVAGSVPEQELAESAAKLVPMRDALQS
ncbi:MAG: isochorismate synthase [Frankiales bacterium]|nr:isochorismate synthase [Frankiales bacterium]